MNNVVVIVLYLLQALHRRIIVYCSVRNSKMRRHTQASITVLELQTQRHSTTNLRQ